MAVFSRYTSRARGDGAADDGSLGALMLINRCLDEILGEQEGDFDADTRWAITWFEQHGFGEASFGEADVPGTSEGHGDQRARGCGGLVEAKAGKVGLLRRDELPDGLGPQPRRHDNGVGGQRSTSIKRLDEGGEYQAAELLRRWAVSARSRASSRTASTRSASARAGRRRRSATTRSSWLAGDRAACVAERRKRSSAGVGGLGSGGDEQRAGRQGARRCSRRGSRRSSTASAGSSTGWTGRTPSPATGARRRPTSSSCCGR